MNPANRLGQCLFIGFVSLLTSVSDLPAPPGPGPGGGPGGPGRGGLPIGNINPAGQAQSPINSQLQQLTRSFNSNDRNRDGQMNQSEFSKMFQSGGLGQFQKKIPSLPGGNQNMANQMFQQLAGNKGSFNLNQLLGFASRLMGGPNSQAGQSKGKMPFRPPNFPKPPVRLPAFLPFGNVTTNSSSTNSSNSTNTTSSSSAEMSLGYAMTEGYVTVKLGSSDRRKPESNLRLRVSRTGKAENRDITLALKNGAILTPTRRSYTPVKVNGFDDVHPRLFTLPKSSDSSYWNIKADKLLRTGRLPFGYIDFTLREGQ